jgi:hypothetical protein
MPSGNIKNLITMDRQTGTPSVATVLCLILSIFSNLNTCENNQNTRDVPMVSTSILLEQEEELQASMKELGTITSSINLNPKQPVEEKECVHKDSMSNDIKSSTMCERTTSICVESIYKDVLKYQLKLSNEYNPYSIVAVIGSPKVRWQTKRRRIWNHMFYIVPPPEPCMVSYRLVLLIDIHILRGELSMMGTYFYTIQNQKSLRRLYMRHKEHIDSESGIRNFVPSELCVKKAP